MVSIKLIVVAVILCFAALASAYPRMYILDDGDVDVAEDVHSRVRRDEAYGKSAGYGIGGGYGKGYGRVGPVYTFVKTDPKANFKWGVRHRVGYQYG